MANPVHHSATENRTAKPSPTCTVELKMDRLQGLLAAARLQVSANDLKRIKMTQIPSKEAAMPLKITKRILLQESGAPTAEPFKRITSVPSMEAAAAAAAESPKTKPLKSCLKRNSSLPNAADLLSSTKNADRTRRSSGERRTRRRERRRQRSNLEEASTQPKGILKRSSTDPTIALKADNIPKRVSFSDLSRWNSQGSGLDLTKLTSKQEKTEPKGNYVWDKTKGKTRPSSCTNLSLSVLTKEVGKYQAPFKPSRRLSGENLRRMQSAATKKKSSGNMFQASLNDFQKAVSACETTRRAPTKPGRRPSLEVGTPEQRDSYSD